MAKSLEQRMMKYFSKLNDAEKKSVIHMLKILLANEEEKINESLHSMNYNKEIDEAIARVESGNFYSHEEVVRMSKKW